MKICFFGDANSIHVKRWCDYFIEKKHEVHLISFVANKEIENILFYNLNAGRIDVRGKNWRTLFTFIKLRKLLKEIKPDVFHSMYATSYGISGALAFYQPYVMTAFGSDILVTSQNSKIVRSMVSWALRRSKWITVTSEQMKTEIIKMDIPSDKIAMLPFGIDPNKFYLNPDLKKEEIFQLISTRNFEPIYNHFLLLNALKLLKEEGHIFKVKMLGKGTLENELKSKIKEYNLENEIQFLGHLSSEEVAILLNKSHVYVSMSLSDANHVSLNEAQACGTLPVVTNIPANQQWIEDKVNGFLCPTDNPLELKNILVHVMKNFHGINQKFNPINQKIIQEKAIWETNISQVEKKYYSLIQKETSIL